MTNTRPKSPPLAPDDGLAAAQKKADDLLDQIHKGASFEDLAKKQSDGPSAQQGGDLSQFKRGVLAKELEDRVFALKAGETTDVIRTKQGFVILKVTEHQMAGTPTLKEMEPRADQARRNHDQGSQRQESEKEEKTGRILG